MMTPMSVSVFGWIRSATQASMIARSGNMQTVPMRPVNVLRLRIALRRRSVGRVAYNGGFSHAVENAT